MHLYDNDDVENLHSVGFAISHWKLVPSGKQGHFLQRDKSYQLTFALLLIVTGILNLKH